MRTADSIINEYFRVTPEVQNVVSQHLTDLVEERASKGLKKGSFSVFKVSAELNKLRPDVKWSTALVIAVVTRTFQDAGYEVKLNNKEDTFEVTWEDHWTDGGKLW